MIHVFTHDASVPVVGMGCRRNLQPCKLRRHCRDQANHGRSGQSMHLPAAISIREVVTELPGLKHIMSTFRPDEADGESVLPPGYLDIVHRINALRPELAELQEHELAAAAGQLKRRHDAGSTMEDLLPEAFALVREATYRKLGKAHYDVQLMGGVVLHKGSIAEMATGEGKSLTGILPAYLYALSGEVVFMVTVNDYLAKRDAQIFHSVLELLGMEVNFALGSMTLPERHVIYESANIVYATAQTLAFDYLFDSVVMDASQVALPTLGFAIIDEVDQVLIDNALSPFIISDRAPFWDKSLEQRIYQAAAVAQGMVRKQLSIAAGSTVWERNPEKAQSNMNQVPLLREALQGVDEDSAAALHDHVVEDTVWDMNALAYENIGMRPNLVASGGVRLCRNLFTANYATKTVEVSRLGFLFARQQLRAMHGVDDQAWSEHRWPALLLASLQAHMTYLRNVDYAVAPDPQTGKLAIVLIDQSTSVPSSAAAFFTTRLSTDRLMPSVKLQDLMHEFLTAKHALVIEPASITTTKITYAKLFERFKKVAGMTGTATESANAFWDSYRLSVVSVPPNKPCIRQDYPRRLYSTDAAAIADRDDIVRTAWVAGRPLLIGTASTAASASIYKSVKETLQRERRTHQYTLEYMTRTGAPRHAVMQQEMVLQRLKGVHVALLNSDEAHAQQESMIVAQAGMLGHITVATNMAGRGTDILLGGDPAQLCGLLLAQPYNQHFVDVYAASVHEGGAADGSEEASAVAEVQAWQASFDPSSNVTARKLVGAWSERLRLSERAGGLLHARFRLVFHSILKSHMATASASAWDAVQFTEWMKRLQEVVLPLMLYVERRLPQISSIRLDADQNPPFISDVDQNAHDPLLQQIWLDQLAGDSHLPPALHSVVLRARAAGRPSVDGGDVMCAVCAAAVEDALESGTLQLSKDLPADALVYALVAHAWLTWFAAQQRKLIKLGGPYTAVGAAAAVARGEQFHAGGLVVLQWGAAHNARVERQLRGRAGRQGDPGESHVIISLEDPTMYAMHDSVVVQRKLLANSLGSETADSFVLSAIRNELNKMYRMRIQNEDASLAADVKRDASLDRWRTMHEHLRNAALHADRSTLLAAYCSMLRQFLPELLQARRVKMQRGRWGLRRSTGEVVAAGDAGGEGLGPAVDSTRHPRSWCLRGIAALLDEIVNTSSSDSPDNLNFITLEAVSVVNAASLQQFLDTGTGTLPYPGSEVSSLDLWYAGHLSCPSAHGPPPLLSRLADTLLAGGEQPWRGRFARQAEMLTEYLAQLLVSRLVQKELLSMDNAMFQSSHLRVPVLRALDSAWQSVILEEKSIQSSQGLDSLAALDPEAEYKARLAAAFSVHYSRVAENACRTAFLDLHTMSNGDPPWVAVQKSRHRTPAEEAGARVHEEDFADV